MIMKKLLFLTPILFLILLSLKPVLANYQESSEGQNFVVNEIVTDHDIIWGMSFMSESELLFTEKSGKLSLLNLKTKKITKISGVPKVYDEGQGGLLDILKDPSNDWIYFTYSKAKGDLAHTVVAKAKLKDNKLTDWQDILDTKSSSSASKHFGSRLVLTDNTLFVSLGDRGHRPNGQDLKTHAGSILRINLDGSAAEGNPFEKREDALPEIWSYGHRNVQGLVYDEKNKNLWAIEHGPRGGDEINLIKKGANYGWPVVSLGREYWNPFMVGEATSKSGMEDPIMQYTPSIAPCGLEMYSGKVFKAWKGNLFTGALALTHLNRLVLEGKRIIKEERLLKKLDQRVRSVKEGPDGLIYLSTDEGKILQIAPAK